MATLFPPATLAAVEIPVPGVVQALIPNIMDGTSAEVGNPEGYMDTGVADPFSTSHSGQLNLLGNLFNKVSRNGSIIQPLAVGCAIDYAFPVKVHIPRYECLPPRPRSQGPGWDSNTTDTVVRTMAIGYFNNATLLSVHTNSSFGINCDACEDDHTLKHGQVVLIAAADAMPDHYGALNNPTKNKPSLSVGFANGTMGPDPWARGNVSIAAYDFFKKDVFITDCQLYNMSVRLNISVINRQSTIQVLSHENVNVIDLSIWFPEAEGMNPDFPNYSAYQATKRWIREVYTPLLGGMPIAIPPGRFEWISQVSGTVFDQSREYSQALDYSMYEEDMEKWNRTEKPGVGEILQELSTNFSLSLMSDEVFS